VPDDAGVVGEFYYSAARDGLVALVIETNSRSTVYRILGRTGRARMEHQEFQNIL